jgi:hypothetical protein
VRGGDGECPLVVGERGASAEIWLADGKPIAQDVDVAAAQRPVGIEGLHLGKPDLAGGVAGLECRDEPAERGPVGGEHEADAQQPAHRTRQLAGLGQCLIQSSERGLEAAPELFTCWCQADPAAGALEDLYPEAGLHDAHGLAHRGLGDAHALGGSAEVQLVGEVRKIRSSRSSTSRHINQES